LEVKPFGVGILIHREDFLWWGVWLVEAFHRRSLILDAKRGTTDFVQFRDTKLKEHKQRGGRGLGYNARLVRRPCDARECDAQVLVKPATSALVIEEIPKL